MKVVSSIVLCSTALTATVTAFTAASTDNLAIYWGQNSAGSQQSLASYCQDSTIDIIPISFLTAFGTGAYSLNFANACEGATVSGSTLLQCDKIAADIKTCQAAGKKIFLSIGGASGAYGFSSAAQATQVADDLWNYFGGGSSSIRPFGTSIVDGFDLDIENNAPAFYPEFISQMRSLYATDASKSYYISGAPQCVYPDASLKDALAGSWFDFLFIQFYNNWCGVYQYGASSGAFNYDVWNTWATQTSVNKGVKLFLGVAAAPGAANAGSGYVPPALMVQAAQGLKSQYPGTFGGVMMWDASQAYANTPAGYSSNYAQIAKQALAGPLVSKAIVPVPVSASAVITTIAVVAPTTKSSTSTSTSQVAPVTTKAAPLTTKAAIAATSSTSTIKSTGSTACSSTYTVVSGDYCYAIWTSHGLTSDTFYALNPALVGTTNCPIYPGQVLCVGTGAATTTLPAAAPTTTSTTTVKITSTSTTTTKVAALASTSSIAAAATTSPGSVSSGSTCPDPKASCTDGSYVCNGYGYLQCDHGLWLQRSCPSGTACASSGANVWCDWPGTAEVTCHGISGKTNAKRSLAETSAALEAEVTTSMSQQRINATHFLVTLKAEAVGIMPIPADWYFSFDSEQAIVETDVGVLYHDVLEGWYSVSADPLGEMKVRRQLTVRLTGEYVGSVSVPRRQQL